MKNFLRKIISKFSKYSIIYENSFDLIKTMDTHKIDFVVDIGASWGGYSRMLRRFGYKEEIVSIEPVNHSYKKLIKFSSKDKKWSSKRLIISNQKKNKLNINVSKDFENSSILNSTELHKQNHNDAVFIHREEVECKSLDQLMNEYIDQKKNMMLKLDVQGSEADILESGINSLSKFKLVQIELSLQKLYDNQILWKDIVDLMYKKNFENWTIFPGYKQRNKGQLYQFDAIFFNKN